MINNAKELTQLRDHARQSMEIRLDRPVDPSPENHKIDILVCGVAGCASSGSLKVADEIEEQIKKNGLGEEVKVIKTGCFGFCRMYIIVAALSNENQDNHAQLDKRNLQFQH